MKIILSFVTIALFIHSYTNLSYAMKCDRISQASGDIYSEIHSTKNVNEEITSTIDYLEFNNKKIEKVLLPKNDLDGGGKLSVDLNGNIFFQEGEKLFIRRRNDENAMEIMGLVLHANRTNPFLVDRITNNNFIGTHNGLFLLMCGGTRAVHINATKNIAVDFGVIDSYGNIYFGTDGSNTVRSEQLYLFHRKSRSLIEITGIETSLGSYPIESKNNVNKIAIDSKDNVYLGAYSSYVYLLKSGDTVATKIKENHDNGGVTGIVIDSKDNVYCRSYTELLVYTNGTFIKILETVDYFDLFITVDNNDDVHFNIADEEYILKPRELSAIEVNMSSDREIILDKNLLVRNNIFYFTTRGGGDLGAETICALKQGEMNITEIYKGRENHAVAVDEQNNIFFTATSSKVSNKIVPYVLRWNARMPIEIRGLTSRLINGAYADKRNNVYFSASNGLHVLNFDEVTPHRLRATAGNVSSVVIDRNGNVYFGTYYDGAFILKAGESEATKINGIAEVHEEYGPTFVQSFADKNYDVVYFRTNEGGLYKLMSGDTFANRVIEKINYQFVLSDCRNNTYYVNENNIFLIKSGELTAKKIAYVYGQIITMDIDRENRLYFATTIGLQVLNSDETVVTQLSDTLFVHDLAIDDDNDVYFGTDVGAFVLKSGVVYQIQGIDEPVVKVVINTYDIYFITNMGQRLFLLQNKLELSNLFKQRILGKIDDNEDDTILSALNFLNIGNDYLLNRSKNKVMNKTETTATIVGIRGKYFGQFRVEYTIRRREDEANRYFIDIDFLKKAIFFNYINENLFNYKMNDLKDIEVDIENLRFTPVEVIKDSELDSSFEFETVCGMKKAANTSPVDQIFKFPECNYKGKQAISFEITTGMHRGLDVPFTIVVSADDEMILSDYLYKNDSTNEQVMLSEAFLLSDSNYFSRETTLYDFFEPEQEILVPPKQQISVKYSVRTFTNKIYLKLIQKIQGVIVSKLRDNIGEQVVQITLRNAMRVLEKFSQLPIEVVIRDDNSIDFVGKAILVSQRQSMPMVIRNFV